MCTLYRYMNICIPRFSPSGFFGPSRCLIPTPGLTSEHPICAVRVCVCVYTHTRTHTLPPALKIEKTQTTPLYVCVSVGASVCKRVYVRVCACNRPCVCAYESVYLHICVCVCIQVHMSEQPLSASGMSFCCFY